VSAAPPAVPGQVVLSEGERSGSERRWRLRLPDGRAAVLAELLPELARDEALRRRYVRDAERLAALDVDGLARVLAIGPAPDPRDPAAPPPWRLRLDPPGETLERRLAARAPLPVDEAVALGVELAELLARVHARGAVLRDLQPAQLVLSPTGLVLTDVGLARVDILSTRSAASMIIEGSPYAAPEHLRARIVDGRADLYSAGVILWRALTATLPHGDGPALLREHHPLPPLERIVPGAPRGLGELLARMLAERPEARPDSALEVAAALRGDPAAPRSLEVVTCQACGARLRAGLRLCLSCGKQAVQFHHVTDGDGWILELTAAREQAAYLEPLRRILEAVSAPPLPRLAFLTEDLRMYAKEEKDRLIRLPALLFAGLTRETARELERRMKAAGLEVRAVEAAALRRRRWRGIAFAVAGGAGVAGGVALAAPVALVCGLAALPVGIYELATSVRRKRPTLFTLRRAPAALPAADPLLARLGALVGGAAPPDVREQVTELAVLVSRLAEHRATHLGAAADIDAVTGPVAPLVALVERQVAAIARLDGELAGLDEETLSRALAASEARGEPPSRRRPLLEGLDRLRALEDQRAGLVQRLLEATTLLRRAVATGLAVADPDAAQRAELELARAALEG
jgi:hypothetical protein